MCDISFPSSHPPIFPLKIPKSTWLTGRGFYRDYHKAVCLPFGKKNILLQLSLAREMYAPWLTIKHTIRNL